MSKTDPGRFFEDFRGGETLAHATPRTVNEADAALYLALTGTRFAVNSADTFAQRIGYPRAPLDDFLAFHIVFGKTVPDVSINADPQTGYEIFVDGQSSVFGGTSAVAPLMAGLTARLNQQAGKAVGFLNPVLYQQGEAAGVFHDVTQGNNGAYAAAAGWDACTGLGSPDGTKLLGALIPKQQAHRTTASGGKMAAAS